jgi:hypothetical protein
MTSNVRLPSVANGGQEAELLVMGWDGAAEGPLVLQLGVPLIGRATGEAAVASAYFSKNVETNGISYVKHVTTEGLAQAQCVLQYGQGAVTRQVRMDWRQGAYALPPCNQVRVAVLAPPNNVQDFIYSAVLSRGQLGAQFDVPSFTFFGADFDGVQEYPVPIGAHALEVFGETSVTVTFQNELTYAYDQASGLYNPPVSPMRIPDGMKYGNSYPAPFFTVAPADTAKTVMVRFLLGL